PSSESTPPSSPKASMPKSPFGGLFSPLKSSPTPTKAPPAAPKTSAKPSPIKKPSPPPSKAVVAKSSPSSESTPPSSPKASMPKSPFGGLFSPLKSSPTPTKAPPAAPKTSETSSSEKKPSPPPSKAVVEEKVSPSSAQTKNVATATEETSTSTPAPEPTPVAKKALTPKSVTFPPQVVKVLTEALGSPAALTAFSKRTDLYARGAISSMDYWATLVKALGKDGAQSIAPDIIGSLPDGNQKAALLRIYKTK
ncbi:unnamed protein product, partial [Choristocarpus tenellus]